MIWTSILYSNFHFEDWLFVINSVCCSNWPNNCTHTLYKTFNFAGKSLIFKKLDVFYRMSTSIKSIITNTGGQYASTSVSYILNNPHPLSKEKRERQMNRQIINTNPHPKKRKTDKKKKGILYTFFLWDRHDNTFVK